MVELLAAGHPERFLFLALVTMFFAGMGIGQLGLLVRRLKFAHPLRSKILGISGLGCLFVIIKFANNFKTSLPIFGLKIPIGLPMAMACVCGIFIVVSILKLHEKDTR